MSTPISNRKALLEWRLYLFIVPAVVLVGVFCYLPALSAIYHSFFRWSGGDNKEFIGLKNFYDAMGDPVFLGAFVVMAVLVVSNLFKLIPSILIPRRGRRAGVFDLRPPQFHRRDPEGSF